MGTNAGSPTFDQLSAISLQAAAFLERLSTIYGTGNFRTDMFLLVVVIALLLLLIVVSALWLARPQPQDENEILNEIFHRIDQLERQVQRSSQRGDSIEERFRIEVMNLGERLSDILVRIEAIEGLSSRSPTVPRSSFASPAETTPERAPSETSIVPREVTPVITSGEAAPLAKKLASSRRGLLDKIKSVLFGFPTIDADMLEELEVLLVTSDLGLKTVGDLLRDLKAAVRDGGALSREAIVQHLHRQIAFLLKRKNQSVLDFKPFAVTPSEPKVIFVVGVNGVGKTTTVAKLAYRWTSQGARVVLAAADTFRAAADEQLHEWGNRVGVQVVSGQAGDKPATVVHSALSVARGESADILLVDTAGRLHNRGSLMQELEGMVRAAKKLQPGAPDEVWLVIDGTTGQNALVQAREFQSSVPLTGIIVTKLDGTAKGGVVVAITDELGLPIRFIGVGETWNDLRPFDADEFVAALLGDGTLAALEA